MCIVSCIVEFGCAPTVMGLIRTPSSIWAFVASSASFPWRTFFPHKVFTNVVRPEIMCQLPSRFPSTGSHIPVPEAPQTIKQNWIPFLTFFFLRILICKSYGQYRHINMSMCKISNPSMVLPGNAGSESSKGVDDDRPKGSTYCAQRRRHDGNDCLVEAAVNVNSDGGDDFEGGKMTEGGGVLFV